MKKRNKIIGALCAGLIAVSAIVFPLAAEPAEGGGKLMRRELQLQYENKMAQHMKVLCIVLGDFLMLQ